MSEQPIAFDYYVPVRPAPHEQRALRDGVRIAKDLGVQFRAGEVALRWWQRDPHEPLGFIVRTDARPVRVWLGVGGSVEQIVSTSAHEMRHARDWLDGRDRFEDRVGLDGCNDAYHESEARAEAFAARVLARWRAERRPRPTTSPQPGASAPATEERISHMRTMSPALDLGSVPALAADAMRHIDHARLDRRRRIAVSHRADSHWLSDSAITRLTVAIAFLDELLAGDGELEIQTIRDCRNHLAARLESPGVDVPGW